ncbi:MAG: ABC transporter permease [Planctomycetota bacterium]|jgi:ribose transport system permease protein|nr:ABC transporter permease [Planctomycetota bacterium]
MEKTNGFVERLEASTWTNWLVVYIRTYVGILAALFLMVIILHFATDKFLTQNNVINVLRQISTNTNLAIGVMLAILLAGIDLTSGAIVALSGALAAKLLTQYGFSIPLALLCGCLVGALAGLVNGCIIAFTGMPPFVVTLAMMNICRGSAYLVANGKPIRVPTTTYGAFEEIGTGYLEFKIPRFWSVTQDIAPHWELTLPYPVIYTAFFLLLTFFFLSQTRLGRHIYAVGGNREAARFSGINPAKIEIIVYTYSGFLAAVAGVVLAARMASGQPAVGMGYETDAIAAAVLGGASMSGGVGTVGGLIIGALIIGILSNGLNLIGVNSFWQYVAKGVVIILAVYMDIYRKRKERF